MSTKKNTTNTLSSLSVFSSYTEEILAKNHFAKIHSVFPNGFNLNFNGELVYISYHQEGLLSARGISIDQSVFDAITPYLKIGVQVRVKEQQLVFYTRPYIFTVHFTERKVKDLKVRPLTEDELEDFGFQSRLEQLNLLKHSGFATNENLMMILNEIKRENEVNTNHIKRLIGAGIGLTPTGDDFLQGLIFMEQTLQNRPHIQTLVEEQLTQRSTTDVSLSYYQAIFDGYSNEPLVLLAQAIKEGNEEAFHQAISYIRQYGETSGYDLLTGMGQYLNTKRME